MPCNLVIKTLKMKNLQRADYVAQYEGQDSILNERNRDPRGREEK